MRRRNAAEQHATPERLRRFVGEEWGGDRDAPVRFYAAVEAFTAAGGEWDPDWSVPLPDVPFTVDDL